MKYCTIRVSWPDAACDMLLMTYVDPLDDSVIRAPYETVECAWRTLGSPWSIEDMFVTSIDSPEIERLYVMSSYQGRESIEFMIGV